jgi:hypothetical protein
MTDRPKTIGDYVEEQDPRPEGISARIQWKGTDICMDFECKCGHGFHVDGEFVFYIKCPGCDALYAMSPQIRVVEVPAEFTEEVTNGGLLWVEDEPDEEPAPDQGWSMKNGVWTS